MGWKGKRKISEIIGIVFIFGKPRNPFMPANGSNGFCTSCA